MVAEYKIDGYDLFTAFKISVGCAEGLDLIPKVKKRDEHSWAEDSGVQVDATTQLVYEALDISLTCYIKESTYSEALKRVNGLIKILSTSGLHILESGARNKSYPVLLDEVSNFSRFTKFNAAMAFFQFTLKLRGPLPECRNGSATVLEGGSISVNANTGRSVTVWWGDGSNSTGTGLLTHIFANTGTYKQLIAGTGVTSSTFIATGVTIEDYASAPIT